MESRMRWKSHVRFGGRAGETDQPKRWHRAPVRSHLGRSVTAHQRTALEARGYACEVPGCGATTALEIDHIEDWHKSFRTTLDQLAWLCRAHHQAKTHHHWRLQGPPGARRWVHGEASSARDGPNAA